MNEGPSATIMHDSSPSGPNGRIGSAVQTGVVTDGRTGYQWPAAGMDTANRERLVRVSRSRLNPGRAGFAVIVRFHTGFRPHQHLIQKGQAGAAGGMWKIGMKDGKVGCYFEGSADRAAIWSRESGLADNAWHTVRCVRRSTGVAIIVDGGQPKTNPKWTGKIENEWPTSIAGKWKCNPPNVNCAYFAGRIDRIVIKRQR